MLQTGLGYGGRLGHWSVLLRNLLELLRGHKCCVVQLRLPKLLVIAYVLAFLNGGGRGIVVFKKQLAGAIFHSLSPILHILLVQSLSQLPRVLRIHDALAASQ